MSFKHGATLNGLVNPNGLSTEVQFEYGIDEKLGTVVPVTDPIVGYTDVPVSADLVDLAAETKYFFLVVATNALGKSEGEILTFTTLVNTDVPTAVTVEASNIT